MDKTEELGYNFMLPIGLQTVPNGEKEFEVELLRANGVAEKVFTNKLPSKVFTWYGNVISIATKSIGPHLIGAAVREQYIKDKTIEIPPVVKKLFFADANTMVVEIHRRVWQNLIPNQRIACMYCTKDRLMDIDLNRIKFNEEEVALVEQLRQDTDTTIIVDLRDGFDFVPPINNSIYEDYKGMVVNRFIYRIPTLGDAIKNEEVIDDSVTFWRQIAFDCLKSMHVVTTIPGKDGGPDEEHVIDIPVEANTHFGLKLYNSTLSSRDLKTIREALRETIPTLPFAYEENCGCPRQKTIPVVMEASSFFTE